MACRVFFSRPAESWLTPAWLDARRVVEVQLRYDTRVAWNPLNQSAVSSNYESRMYLQAVRPAAATSASQLTQTPAVEFARYNGWTLNGSVYAFGDCVLAVRGTEESRNRPGGPEREVLCWPLPLAANSESREAILAGEAQTAEESVPVLKPAAGEFLLAAIPAPRRAGALLAVFLTRSTLDDRREELLLDVYRLAQSRSEDPDRTAQTADRPVYAPHFEKLSRRTIPWGGDPGMPDVAWSRDGRRIFIKRLADVVETTGDPGAQAPDPPVESQSGGVGYRVAPRFPRCFRGTDSGAAVSPDGWYYVPVPAGSQSVTDETSAGEPGANGATVADSDSDPVRGFRLEPAPGWRSFENTDLITEFRRIGYGCQ